jgi:hypothetical protein
MVYSKIIIKPLFRFLCFPVLFAGLIACERGVRSSVSNSRLSSYLTGSFSLYSGSNFQKISTAQNKSKKGKAFKYGEEHAQCTSPVVKLYRIANDGIRETTALAESTIADDGTYKFDITALNVTFTDKVSYSVEVEGCSEAYSRPITDRTGQDISAGSTLISYIQNSTALVKLNSIKRTDLDPLLAGISSLSNSSSISGLYSNLMGNSSLTAQFSQLFGTAPSALLTAGPKVKQIIVPTEKLIEQQGFVFSVTSTHWNPDYNPAIKWKLDTTVLSTQSTFTYTPSANSQGVHSLTLYIGASDGAGGIDLNKPVQSFPSTITILNSSPPVPPAVTLTSPARTGNSPVSNRALTLTINTGSGLSNCRSFSSLALTEDSDLPPTEESDFNITCSQAGSQAINYNLASSGDGVKVLRLWARDISGNISTAASSISVPLDTNSPTITLVSAPSSSNKETSLSFDFAATDNGGTIDFYQCKKDNGSWFTCSSPYSWTAISEGIHSLYVRAFDTAENTSNTASYSWTTDLTAPVLNVSGSPATLVSSVSNTFTFSASDTGGSSLANIQCSLNGASWSPCISPNISVLSAGTHLMGIKAVDGAGNESIIQSFTWTIDISPPTVTISSAPPANTSSTSVSILFSGSDTGGSSIQTYECKIDAAPYSSCSSPKTYTGLTEASHTFSVRAIDGVGNVSTVATTTWTVDTTNPTATITTPAANGSFVQTADLAAFTVGGTCSEVGRPIILSGVVTTPTSTCSFGGTWTANIDLSAASAGNLSLTATHADSAGNSVSATSTFIKEITAPVISITTPSATKGNSNTGSVTWALTETNIPASTTALVEIYNGSTWTTVGTVNISAGANSAQTYSLTNFAVPNISTNSAKMRVTIADAAGNSTTQESGSFLVDGAAPILSSVSINDGAAYAGTNILSVKLNVVDDFSTGTQIQIRLAAANTSTSDCQSEYINNNWQTWNGSSYIYTFATSPTDGTKKVCAWAKDSFGNISVIVSPSTGTDGVNQDSIIYQTGNSPIILSFNVYNPSNNRRTFTATNQPTQIEWNISDVEGLDNNPISISYTTDNSTWKDIVTNGSIATPGNMTWIGGLTGNPTTFTGSYTTFNAPSTSFFRLKAVARDTAGNTSTVSYGPVLNTGGWSVYAGTTDDGIGGTAKSVRLKPNQSGMTGLFAINPINNDVYALSSAVGLLKLDAKTGIVTNFIPNGSSTTLPLDGSALLSTHRIRAYSGSAIGIDSNGYMYVHDDASNNINSKILYQINLNVSPATVRLYIGGGTNIDTFTSGTDAYFNAGINFDEDNSLYYWANCVPGSDVNIHQTVRLMKATQDATTKLVNAVTPVAGDCSTSANPTSGLNALSTPLAGNTTTMAIGAMTIWDHGNKIYFSMYSKPTYKIINGIIYTTALPTALTSIFYRSGTNKLWHTISGGGIYQSTPVTGAAGGESFTEIVNSSSSSLNCRDDNIDAASTCVTVSNNFSQTTQGTMFFVDGPSVNSNLPYRIRYLDENNKVQTLMGSKPLYGDGLHANLARGVFGGIFYKPATLGGATALTAFPEGLYFVDNSGPTFGYIHPSTKTLSILFGNQRGAGSITSGSTISSGITMGNTYGFINGRLLTFDDNGLPWLGAVGSLFSIDSSKVITRRNASSPNVVWAGANNDTNLINATLSINGGESNLNVYNNLGYIGGTYYGLPSYPHEPNFAIFNFGSIDVGSVLAGKMKRIYGSPSATGFSVDSANDSPANSVSTASKTLDVYCRSNSYPCRLQYHPSSDRLYFTEKDKLRYISNPNNMNSSTVSTVFSLSTTSQYFYNFIVSLDGTKIFYLRDNGRLFCYNLSGTEPQCNLSTALNPTGNMTFGTGAGPNQMTWMTNTKLLISDYGGQIFQYEFTPTP